MSDRKDKDMNNKKAALRQQDGTRHETWQKGRHYDTTENFAVQEDSCVYAGTRFNLPA